MFSKQAVDDILNQKKEKKNDDEEIERKEIHSVCQCSFYLHTEKVISYV